MERGGVMRHRVAIAENKQGRVMIEGERKECRADSEREKKEKGEINTHTVQHARQKYHLFVYKYYYLRLILLLRQVIRENIFSILVHSITTGQKLRI